MKMIKRITHSLLILLVLTALAAPVTASSVAGPLPR